MGQVRSSDASVTETPSLRWTEWLRDHGFDELFGIENGHPHVFDKIEWRPTSEDRAAAWKLYTELRTRITT